MSISFDSYNFGFRIVSLALNKEVRDDLLHSEIDFLYVTSESITLLPQNVVLSKSKQLIEHLRQFHNYDVWEIWQDGRMIMCYDTQSIENCFFITPKCNSNCLMCPSPNYSRQRGEHTAISKLITLARHIPASMKHLTITGGEPFLVGTEIFDLFGFFKRKFENTEFLILTNGRIFAIQKYIDLLCETIPQKTILAIPVHGSCPDIHDSITQVAGSFQQTIHGIKNLISNGIRIELRIVISKLNMNDLDSLVDLIVSELSGIEYISIIAMEMTGSAYINRELVWIPYKTAFSSIKNGIIKLLKNGIDVKLYNFPLCTVDPNFWTICEKSITSDKVRYSAKCDNCRYKTACGGVFAGTLLLEQEELKAIR